MNIPIHHDPTNRNCQLNGNWAASVPPVCTCPPEAPPVNDRFSEKSITHEEKCKAGKCTYNKGGDFWCQDCPCICRPATETNLPYPFSTKRNEQRPAPDHVIHKCCNHCKPPRAHYPHTEGCPAPESVVSVGEKCHGENGLRWDCPHFEIRKTPDKESSSCRPTDSNNSTSLSDWKAELREDELDMILTTLVTSDGKEPAYKRAYDAISSLLAAKEAEVKEAEELGYHAAMLERVKGINENNIKLIREERGRIMREAKEKAKVGTYGYEEYAKIISLDDLAAIININDKEI